MQEHLCFFVCLLALFFVLANWFHWLNIIPCNGRSSVRFSSGHMPRLPLMVLVWSMWGRQSNDVSLMLIFLFPLPSSLPKINKNVFLKEHLFFLRPSYGKIQWFVQRLNYELILETRSRNSDIICFGFLCVHIRRASSFDLVLELTFLQQIWHT